MDALDLISDPVVEFVKLFTAHRFHHDPVAQSGISRLKRIPAPTDGLFEAELVEIAVILKGAK